MRRRFAIGSALAVVLAAAVATAQPDANPGGGSAGSGSGSAAGTGSGSGSAAGSGSGSGSAKKGPVIVDLPPDVIAPEVSAAASPTEVILGKRFTLFITVVFDEGEKVNLVDPLDVGDAFEVARPPVSADRKRGDGKMIREWQIQLIAWDLGEQMVPPLPVTFTFNGKAAQVGTRPVPIRVVGNLGDSDDKQVRPMSRPAELLSRDWLLAYIAGGVLAAIVLSIIAWQVVRRRRTAVLVPVGVSRRLPRRLDSASEEALRRLAELEKSGRLDDDDTRTAAYREMSDIMRTYIGRRGGFAHHDRTTAEIVERMRARPIAGFQGAVGELEAWLEGCDLVKFAAYDATAREGHAALAAARELVIATVVQPQPTTPAPVEPAPAAEPPPPSPPEEPAGG